ncbi:MAG: hypothetical protein ABN479_03750 [Billgrantia sp.]
MLTRILLALLLTLLAVAAWQFQRAQHLDAMLDIEAEALARMTAHRDAWHERTMSVLEQLGEERRRSRAAERAVVELQEVLAERDADYREIQRRIRQAPAEADGPVAPVLRETLEALP